MYFRYDPNGDGKQYDMPILILKVGMIVLALIPVVFVIALVFIK